MTSLKSFPAECLQLTRRARDANIVEKQAIRFPWRCSSRTPQARKLPAAPNAAAERTREVSASVVHVSDAATKAGELANAVLSAGIGFAERSDRLRAEVERFLAQVRVA